MKRSRVSKFFLASAVGAAFLALPVTASASSISGTVTDSVSHNGIEGVEVCPTPRPYTFETSCVVTGPTGQYRYEGLPGGNYIVYFSANRANLKYVSEFYDHKAYSWEADLFELGSAEDKALNVELAEGGSISGIVTDEATELPIPDIRACAIDHQGIPRRCSDTNASGEYQLNGLPTGAYDVEYEGDNRVNYLREFFEDAETWAQATDVTVTAPTTTSSIDAKLTPGAQILGHVSEVGTGIPLANVRVCAEAQPAKEYEDCAPTDAAGNYAMRSLPAATYLVSFDVEYAPISHFQIFGQWWQGAATRAEATPIDILSQETRSGIDGQLPKRYQPSPPEPIQVSTFPTPRSTLPLHCKQGFRKKWIKGKQHCVKVHRKHHRNESGHGPHAVATGR
jgi:hypothetical protein